MKKTEGTSRLSDVQTGGTGNWRELTKGMTIQAGYDAEQKDVFTEEDFEDALRKVARKDSSKDGE